MEPCIGLHHRTQAPAGKDNHSGHVRRKICVVFKEDQKGSNLYETNTFIDQQPLEFTASTCHNADDNQPTKLNEGAEDMKRKDILVSSSLNGSQAVKSQLVDSTSQASNLDQRISSNANSQFAHYKTTASSSAPARELGSGNTTLVLAVHKPETGVDAAARRECGCSRSFTSGQSVPDLLMSTEKAGETNTHTQARQCPWCECKKSHTIEAGFHCSGQARRPCCTCCCGHILPQDEGNSLVKI